MLTDFLLNSWQTRERERERGVIEHEPPYDEEEGASISDQR